MLKKGQENLSRERGEIYREGECVVMTFPYSGLQLSLSVKDVRHLAATLTRYADEIEALAALKQKAEEN